MSFVFWVSLIIGLGTREVLAAMPVLPGSCLPTAIYEKLIPVPAGNTVERLLKDAIHDIISNESKTIPEISKKLLIEQAKLLKEKGVRFRMDAQSRWLDILPSADGSELNQLAFRLRQGKGTKHLLRYSPEVLLDDALGYQDLVLAHRQRAIYLSHRDVLNVLPKSEYLGAQMKHAADFNLMDISMVQKMGEDGKTYRQFTREYRKSISEKDYLTDYSKDSFVQPPRQPYTQQKDRLNAIIYDYLGKSPELTMIVNREDPIVTRIGPFKRMGRESYGVPITDIQGAKKIIYDTDGFRVSELSGPTGQTDRSVYDVFLQDSYRDHLMNDSKKYRRALVLPDGKTLVHLSGAADTRAYFNAHLDFLKTIYTDPNGLNLSSEIFEKLRAKSLELSDRSELFVRARSKAWLKNPSGKETLGGMILVKSENPSQMLPMRDAHPNLDMVQPENEVWVEAGRLGSLTADETIQFLKIAGASLHYQYPNKVVRIICEGSRSRAKLFKRFGFTEAATKIEGKSYYPDGSDLVLQVTLEDFLKHVLK